MLYTCIYRYVYTYLGLTTLRLDGNQERIEARFLASHKLRFATLALNW